VRAYRDDALLDAWLSAQAKALSQLGRWREAFEALSASREIEARLQTQKQSEQSARLRMQFNRQKDASELSALAQINEQGERLRTAQALAIALFVVLLLVSLVFTGRKIRQARRHQTMALTDELTGLPNRRAVLASADGLLRKARATGGTLSLLMIDVDHFKRVNDTHGHAVGDEVLRHLAQLLSAALRTRDRLGRLGGEEFLVVLPDASVEHAVMIAQRMRLSVESAPCITATGKLAFTISIGVAEVGEPSETVSSMIARSDAALYAAKASGRNAVSIQGHLAPRPA
jgi:diguanylate cyclase (GGDEF)-like protein